MKKKLLELIAEYEDEITAGLKGRYYNDIHDRDVDEAKLDRLEDVVTDLKSVALSLTESVKILKDEAIRGTLTSLPRKLQFMRERGFNSIEEVHDWMSKTSAAFKNLVEEL